MFFSEKMTIYFSCERILIENRHIFNVRALLTACAKRALMTQEIMRGKDAKCNSVESL